MSTLFLYYFITCLTVGGVKGKSITFRPKKEMRDRLDALADATERPITFFIDKAIEACLPELEKRYGIETKYPAHKGERVVVEEKAGASSETKAVAQDLLDVKPPKHPPRK